MSKINNEIDYYLKKLDYLERNFDYNNESLKYIRSNHKIALQSYDNNEEKETEYDEYIYILNDDCFDMKEIDIIIISKNNDNIINMFPNILLLGQYYDNNEEKETEYDEHIYILDDDCFNKKEVNTEIISKNNDKSISIINTFPNALLLEESIFNDKCKTNGTNIDKYKKEENKNIWDVLNNINKENISESIDNITTDSETLVLVDKINKCKGCNGKNTLIEDQSTSVMVCSNCGMINEELFDYGPEWRQYNNDDNRGEGINRCGCPTNFFFSKSSQGTILVGHTNSRIRRKQKWNSMVYKERSLNNVLEYITNICIKNNIPKIIIDTAKILYKKLNDCKHKNGNNIGKQIIIRGENRISIIAACVFRACEMNKQPRSIKQIAEFFNIDEKKITKGNKQYDKIMKNTDDDISLDQFTTDSAEDYIRSTSQKLKIKKEEVELAVKIANNCCRMKLASDHNPQSIAAGSILAMIHYLNLNIDKKKIVNLFETSDVTISKIYNKLEPIIDALVDDEITDHLIKKFKING